MRNLTENFRNRVWIAIKKTNTLLISETQLIRRHGWLSGRSLAFKCIKGLLALFLVILVRLIRPLLWIRFGVLFSDRIGHFVTDIEFYLCERELGLHPIKAIDVFSYSGDVCNTQLKIMCERTLNVIGFTRYMERINRFLPGGGDHAFHILAGRPYGSRDIEGFLIRTNVHIKFTPEEIRQGFCALEKMGVTPGSQFICFHARDSVYLKMVYPDQDCSYHDYRDCSINNYIPAVEEMSRRGTFSIRMGAVVKESLKTKNPMIIDYPRLKRTEFLDIFLSAYCRFFVGSGSGIDSVASVFRRPIAYTNIIPLELAPSQGPQDLFIPKKLWLTRERRFLRFREIFQLANGTQYLRKETYARLGIEVVENSSNEIEALTREMDDRLLGKWRNTEEDEELQKRFWSLFPLPSRYHGAFQSRIGSQFLLKNRHLLD
ncbi:MAG: TIGR04372 family glycosyltransferase [Elusimicrobia bacterium]|jgi:putative glycosyltransferase (TIGR04372 family)|nr:TIGR04372 family glycosyltransferase [Elusimicrobiota bacterium]